MPATRGCHQSAAPRLSFSGVFSWTSPPDPSAHALAFPARIAPFAPPRPPGLRARQRRRSRSRPPPPQPLAPGARPPERIPHPARSRSVLARRPIWGVSPPGPVSLMTRLCARWNRGESTVSLRDDDAPPLPPPARDVAASEWTLTDKRCSGSFPTVPPGSRKPRARAADRDANAVVVARYRRPTPCPRHVSAVVLTHNPTPRSDDAPDAFGRPPRPERALRTTTAGDAFWKEKTTIAGERRSTNAVSERGGAATSRPEEEAHADTHTATRTATFESRRESSKTSARRAKGTTLNDRFGWNRTASTINMWDGESRGAELDAFASVARRAKLDAARRRDADGVTSIIISSDGFGEAEEASGVAAQARTTPPPPPPPPRLPPRPKRPVPGGGKGLNGNARNASTIDPHGGAPRRSHAEGYRGASETRGRFEPPREGDFERRVDTRGWGTRTSAELEEAMREDEGV